MNATAKCPKCSGPAWQLFMSIACDRCDPPKTIGHKITLKFSVKPILPYLPVNNTILYSQNPVGQNIPAKPRIRLDSLPRYKIPGWGLWAQWALDLFTALDVPPRLFHTTGLYLVEMGQVPPKTPGQQLSLAGLLKIPATGPYIETKTTVYECTSTATMDYLRKHIMSNGYISIGRVIPDEWFEVWYL